MIIVVGITGLILPVVFSIVFVILQQQTKIIRLQEVKRQGDFVLSSMKTAIKNSAVQIYNNPGGTEQCNLLIPTYGPQDGDTFYFKDKIGNYFKYYLNAEKISSYSAAVTSDLTNNKVKISLFSISCQRQSIYSPAIVTLSVKLEYNTTSVRSEDTAELTYNTNIKLKSY